MSPFDLSQARCGKAEGCGAGRDVVLHACSHRVSRSGSPPVASALGAPVDLATENSGQSFDFDDLPVCVIARGPGVTNR